MIDVIRSEALSSVGLNHLADFIPPEHDENIFLAQMEIWKANNIEIGYLLVPFSATERLIENGLSCPFEVEWNGVSIGLGGELHFPFGNGICCYKNKPEYFEREKYFITVAAILPGVDSRTLQENEAHEFEFNCMPCDSLLISNEIWVVRSKSQILPLYWL